MDEVTRADLVDRVWKLKLAMQAEAGTYIHFKMCLDDPDYRRKMVDLASASDSGTLRRQAGAIRELDAGGALLRRPQRDGAVGSADAPGGEALVAQHGAVSMAPAPAVPVRRAPMPRRGGGFFTVILLLAAVGATSWYLDLHRGLPAALSGLLKGRVVVSGSIVESTTWSAGRVVELEGLVFVESDARLIIEPGVTVRGRPGSALIVTRDGTISARGTAERPIVFTSAQPVGQRKAGDWGGLVLLGNAPLNRGQGQIEGIESSDSRGSFGGSDALSNCGVLEYVRVEFAGFEIGANNELNGLTLGGCGASTIVRHVQSHRGKDDGIEVFGGTVDLRRVVVTGAADDAFDWDWGWTGRVQFLVVQQYPDVGDNGFEGDNEGKHFDAEPRSSPRFYNVTMVGSRNREAGQRAMIIREGSGGVFRNFVITGFPLEAIDLRDEPVAALIDSGALAFGNMILHDIGAGGSTFFATETGESDDDGGFEELLYFARSGADIHLGVDPLLDERAFDIDDPWMTPPLASPAVNGEAPRSGDEFWDEAADYLGAFRPGERTNWMSGWTAFPVN